MYNNPSLPPKFFPLQEAHYLYSYMTNHIRAMCHRMLQMTFPIAYIEPMKLLGTLGAIYTKSLVGRVWKILKMPRDVLTSLHYGGRHERSLRLSREF